jgi:peptidoglycan/LPS O-acetylase OafA/YrhL
MDERLHLKGLNGLRAIAAIGVVIRHTISKGLSIKAFVPLGLADFAVTIFFTLSGFLITYLLFLEKEKKEISIKNFYIRRILRIWPLYFAYLFTALIIIWLQGNAELPGPLPFYLFFAANIPSILHTHLPYLGHYWSLGVEEQFYLFWPWVIKKSKRPLKAIIIFTLIFLVLKLIARLYFFNHGNTVFLNALYITRFDCMSIGGIGALLCLKKNELFLKITTHRITEITGWLCLVVIASNRFFVTYFVNHEIVSAVTLCLIVNLSFNNRSLISLENKCFNFLGRISYGIYIIHPLIILFFKRTLPGLGLAPDWEGVLRLILVLIFTITAAWLSYAFFEKKFLNMKERFSIVKTSG